MVQEQSFNCIYLLILISFVVTLACAPNQDSAEDPTQDSISDTLYLGPGGTPILDEREQGILLLKTNIDWQDEWNKGVGGLQFSYLGGCVGSAVENNRMSFTEFNEIWPKVRGEGVTYDEWVDIRARLVIQCDELGYSQPFYNHLTGEVLEYKPPPTPKSWLK